MSDPVEGLSEIALVRREQILDAAEAIITGHGIQKLSLGQIEDRAGMSRGQLTYYFPTKESILLAVHDRMLRRMIREAMADDGPKPMTGRAWDCLQHGLQKHLGSDWPPHGGKELYSLLFTFLAQMAHKEAYRARLAQWYSEWRSFIAADVAGSVPEPRLASPRVVAALIQALFHGLDVQLLMDPNAFDRQEMFAACVKLLAPLFGQDLTSPLERKVAGDVLGSGGWGTQSVPEAANEASEQPLTSLESPSPTRRSAAHNGDLPQGGSQEKHPTPGASGSEG